MAPLDPRLNAYRPDLADIRLKGQVEAARFVEGERRRVVANTAPLKRRPEIDAPLDSEILRGEAFRVFDEATESGWAWGQLETDGTVGYVPSDALGDIDPRPTHRVKALRTFIYPGPELKLPPTGFVSLASRLTLGGSAETRGTQYLLLAGGAGAVVATHVEPEDAPLAGDFVAVAERFVGVPYLWGGRTSLGLDCSGLVQLALMVAGKGAPRDSDLQETMVGTPVEGGASAALKRGDLVFWLGHVGIMIDGEYLLHASGRQMAVTIEPLGAVNERTGPPSSCRRL